MAVLTSPGVSISVTDQSLNIGAGPGTIPLIFIATQQNKTVPEGTSVAPGTLKVNAGKIYSITSQRELVQTFGDPIFYEVSGTSLNGYPLNEYGLLAAYSYLGISNLTRIVRADIDTTQLVASSVEPTSPAAVGTYWLDESALPDGTSWGLFQRTGSFPSEVWSPVAMDFVFNFASGTTNAPPTGTGANGDYAVVFQTAAGEISYWAKSAGAWVQLTGSTGPASIIIQSVWPDLTSTGTTQQYWVKTGSAAQGANTVLRRMDATLAQFVQVEAPILTNDTAANTYYSSNPAGSLGQIYLQPTPAGTADSLTFRRNLSGTWSVLTTVVGSTSVPTSGPLNGQLWFNSEIGADSAGQITVDMLIADGEGSWQNVNLAGWTTFNDDYV
jgi:hypothetical protein